jgi:hypothetical protein
LLRAAAAIAVLGGALTLGAATPSGASSPTPVTQASTSALGVTATTINVVFPVVSFSSIEGQFEIASDAEYGEQVKAIRQPDQHGRWHQRSEDQPAHRVLRPHQ